KAEDGIRDRNVTGVQTCALPISENLGDGNYTHDYTFEKAGIYEIAAHSNIKEIDPLPQKEIVVTQANTNKENFDLQFIKPKNIVINEKTTLETHVTNDAE